MSFDRGYRDALAGRWQASKDWEYLKGFQAGRAAARGKLSAKIEGYWKGKR